jgi:hypothetical protein
MEIKLLIDGDWLVYAAGFAGQKTKYFAPQLGNEEFDNMTEVKNEAKAQNDGVPDTGAVYSRTIVDPLGHILHSAKNMLNGAIEKAEEKFGNGHTVTPIVYVDGDGNFRNRIATIRPYKGNRVSAKPVAFVDIKDYLVDQWGAQIVYDQESDDQMAIDSGLYEFPVIWYRDGTSTLTRAGSASQEPRDYYDSTCRLHKETQQTTSAEPTR